MFGKKGGERPGFPKVLGPKRVVLGHCRKVPKSGPTTCWLLFDFCLLRMTVSGQPMSTSLYSSGCHHSHNNIPSLNKVALLRAMC